MCAYHWWVVFAWKSKTVIWKKNCIYHLNWLTKILIFFQWFDVSSSTAAFIIPSLTNIVYKYYQKNFIDSSSLFLVIFKLRFLAWKALRLFHRKSCGCEVFHTHLVLGQWAPPATRDNSLIFLNPSHSSTTGYTLLTELSPNVTAWCRHWVNKRLSYYFIIISLTV